MRRFRVCSFLMTYIFPLSTFSLRAQDASPVHTPILPQTFQTPSQAFRLKSMN